MLSAKIIRALLPGGPKGYKIMVKPLAKAQTFPAMIGYITKDSGRPSFQIRTHNVSAQVIV